MVDFGKTKYFNPLDSQVEDIHIGELGASTIGDPLQSIKTEIAGGASHVEVVFTGMGKSGFNSNDTPEKYGKLKREEIRRLSQLNDTTVSTHTSIAVTGLAGQTQQGFSKQESDKSIQEVKKTIEFAADAAGGGAVVVHTGEFARAVKDKRFSKAREKDEVISLADRQTGQIVKLPKDTIIHMPKWQTDKKGNLLDINNKKITPDQYEKRVPLMKNGEIQFEQLTYNKVKKRVDTHNKNSSKKLNADEQFYLLNQREQWEKSYAMFAGYNDGYNRRLLEVEQEKRKIKAHEANLKKAPKEQRNQIKQEIELGKLKIQANQEAAMREKAGAIGYQKDLEKIKLQQQNIKSIETVGLERAADAYAEAAVFAYDIEKKRKLDKELFIAPENMMSDPQWGFGSHPDELRDIVVASRKKMAKTLVSRGMDEKKAKKVAGTHIKATFDMGHANTWQKYFEGDPKKSTEENKKTFDKWLLNKVKDLTSGSNPVVGHVHISDNFGYNDEHLTVGSGNAPIKDFLKLLKNQEYEGKIIVERGAQDQNESPGATVGAWARLAGSPIYKVGGGATGPRWSDIEHSGYFSAASSPNVMIGKYASSLGRDWNMWGYSEAPIE
jgi:sugar phosphate isomerase/epimerase